MQAGPSDRNAPEPPATASRPERRTCPAARACRPRRSSASTSAIRNSREVPAAPVQLSRPWCEWFAMHIWRARTVSASALSGGHEKNVHEAVHREPVVGHSRFGRPWRGLTSLEARLGGPHWALEVCSSSFCSHASGEDLRGLFAKYGEVSAASAKVSRLPARSSSASADQQPCGCVAQQLSSVGKLLKGGGHAFTSVRA